MERRDEGIIAIARSGDGVIKRRPPVRFKSLTVKKVCRECNNGWMSDLEARFQSEFEQLVIPRSFDDVTTVRTLLGSHRELLIRWLLKSAIVAEHSLSKENELMIPPELSDARNIDIDAHGFHILAAEIGQEGFAVRLRKGYRVFNGSHYHNDQRHRQGFNFSIQLNHLALMLVNCPGAFVGAKSPYSFDGSAVMPLIPSSEVDWGMPTKHLFAEFGHFVESLEVYATTPN
jgi:hypothetical protein